jgi:hypothetical protein
MIAALLQPSVNLGRRLITTQGREDETTRCETNFCDIATCEITRPAKGSMRVPQLKLYFETWPDLATSPIWRRPHPPFGGDSQGQQECAPSQPPTLYRV